MATQKEESFGRVETPQAKNPEVYEDKTLSKQDTHDEDIKPRRDYSGAVAKTDPREKKLVRKLDIWIMVREPLPLHLHGSISNFLTYSRCSG